MTFERALCMSAAEKSELDPVIAAMGPVARLLLGTPTKENEIELRFGTHGKIAVDLTKGVWCDHSKPDGDPDRGGTVVELVMREKKWAAVSAKAWLRKQGYIAKPVATAPQGSFNIVKTYDYVDENGTVLFQVCRLNPKGFRQRAADGSWKVKGLRQVIYHLPEVLAAVAAGQPVYVAEGEKDVDNLRALGLAATCSPGGAGNWKPNYGKFFQGAEVVILPDHDEAGRGYEGAVAASLEGIAARVRSLPLPGLAEGEDVSDWLGRGGTRAELERLAGEAPDAVAGKLAAERPEWMDGYQGGSTGPYMNMANVLVALKSAPELKDCFAFNEMEVETAIVSPLPGEKAEGFAPRLEADHDALTVQAWLQTHGRLPRIGSEAVRSAILLRALENRFHPVRDYLFGLKWDGIKRVDCWLTTYLKADGDEGYLREIGRMFLIAMVERVMNPGCQSDYVMVLEANQGSHKSKLCRLLGGQWAGDHLPDIKTKEASQYLKGKWLVELAELASTRKAEIEMMKAFITRREEDYRTPYGRKFGKQPRQNVFMGTTNEAQHLRDATGDRRWWPVKMSGIADEKKFEADRDQLFAEAVAKFQAGERSWPDREFEERVIKPQQNDRYEEDGWREDIVGTLSTWGTNTGFSIRPLTLTNIAMAATDLPLAQINQQVINRVRGVMLRLQWVNRRSNGATVWEPGSKAIVKPPEVETRGRRGRAKGSAGDKVVLIQEAREKKRKF